MLCTNSNYISSFYSCINASCNAANVEIWTQNAEQDCIDVRGTCDTTSSGQVSTTTSTFVQTDGAIVASTTLISQVALSSILSEFGFTYLPSVTSNILQSNTNTASTQNVHSTQTNRPDSLSENDSLPTGAKVGIAVRVVVGVLLVILLAAILWRRKVNRAK